MADIITLNKVRKAKAKQDRTAQAEANRVAFGRTKAEKERDRRDKARADAELSGKKLRD